MYGAQQKQGQSDKSTRKWEKSSFGSSSGSGGGPSGAGAGTIVLPTRPKFAWRAVAVELDQQPPQQPQQPPPPPQQPPQQPPPPPQPQPPQQPQFAQPPQQPQVAPVVIVDDVAEATDLACRFLDAFEFGPFALLYDFLGRHRTSHVARTCYRMHRWAVVHRAQHRALTFQRAYAIPRQFPAVYPNVVALTTWQQPVETLARNACTEPRFTTMFSWAGIQRLHFYVNRHMTLEEAMSFGVMRSLRWLKIESTSWRPRLKSRCRSTRCHFHADEVLGADIRTDAEFMVELGRHALALRHLDVGGLRRLANHWDDYVGFLGRQWPKMEFISPLPASSKKQAQLLHTLTNLAPASVTNLAPQAVLACPPHLLHALTSLHIVIPMSERATINGTKPYLDFGATLDLCPNLVELDISEKVDTGRRERSRCTKPTLILAPTSGRAHPTLRKLTVYKSGRLVLQDVGMLVHRCPHLATINYTISAKYKFEKPGMPNKLERDILRVLKQRDILRIGSSDVAPARVPQSLANRTWGGRGAATFFKGTACWSS